LSAEAAMKRSAFFGLVMLAVSRAKPAGAQQASKTYHVAILLGRTLASSRQNLDAFRRTLAGLSYQEGKNLEIVSRAADGYADRLPMLAADIVRAKPDVIVAAGTAITPTKRATTSIPIVMTNATDPVGAGVVASFARPGGNITGISDMDADLTGKRLQFLKELVPGLRRVAVLRNPSTIGTVMTWREAERSARTMGIQVVAVDIHSPDQIDTALTSIPHLRAEAVLVPADPVTGGNAARIVQLISAQHLPAIYPFGFETFIASGGLISYGPSDAAIWSQAATYVAQILKGSKPADLPVERPTTFDLVVNLKTARILGITVPQSILLQATQVIR
jgi:putative tryptophan/tyrosine transport system substrate-binding protein